MLDIAEYFADKYPCQVYGWRKSKHWRKKLKGQMRLLGKICTAGGQNKEARTKHQAAEYVRTARLLHEKLILESVRFPLTDTGDLQQMIALENYLGLMTKHIHLVERRLVRGETIAHHEKMFSIFETYTEWIAKGKQRPSVELGKNLSVTTDQYQLIVHYLIMDHRSDSGVVLQIADRVLARYKAASWSFDRGYWHPDNKAILQMYVPMVVLPKKGKPSAAEKQQEAEATIRKIKNRHSAVESNIHALETRGLDRCLDRGYAHFKRYIGLAVCAYNLCCIGRALMAARDVPLQKAA